MPGTQGIAAPSVRAELLNCKGYMQTKHTYSLNFQGIINVFIFPKSLKHANILHTYAFVSADGHQSSSQCLHVEPNSSTCSGHLPFLSSCFNLGMCAELSWLCIQSLMYSTSSSYHILTCPPGPGPLALTLRYKSVFLTYGGQQ